MNELMNWWINESIKKKRFWAVICEGWFIYYINRTDSSLGCNQAIWPMQKPIFLVAGDQASIPGVNRVLSPKKLWMFIVCQQKFSEKHTFFFDRLKRLLVVQILEVAVNQENAEHIFNNFSLAKWESRNGGDLYRRAKIDTAKSCIQLPYQHVRPAWCLPTRQTSVVPSSLPAHQGPFGILKTTVCWWC